jgi:adenosylhomocysteinase
MRPADEEGCEGQEGLADKGARRLEWARDHMPVLGRVRKRLAEEGSLKGVRVGMALHVEAKTGQLAIALAEAGAEVRLASCNPLSTDDSVATALRERRSMPVFARRGEGRDEYYRNLDSVLEMRPNVAVDDGGDLTLMLHTRRRDLLADVWGGCEETTTGVVRLRAMAREGALSYPVMDVNDALMKHMFDNRYGTGQSTLDGIMAATNLLLAGKRVLIAGYGWCGRGIAMRARGMGALVTVSEVDPVRAVEALMDGMDVAPMREAIATADLVVTATGCAGVVGAEDLRLARDGVVLANAGHFDVEVDRAALEGMARERRQVREDVVRYTLPDGRRLDLVAEGRLVNLAVGQGHPVEIMDLSFALQALAVEHVVRNRGRLEARVHPLPAAFDDEVARAFLESRGARIDALTQSQRSYLDGWREGT